MNTAGKDMTTPSRLRRMLAVRDHSALMQLVHTSTTKACILHGSAVTYTIPIMDDVRREASRRAS